MSQDTRYYFFLNCGEIVDSDGKSRGVHRYHTRHSSCHSPCDRGILLCLFLLIDMLTKVSMVMKEVMVVFIM